MIYTLSSGPQSYGQINFDLLNQMSSFVVVNLSKDSLLFSILDFSILYFYFILTRERRTKISLTQARLELLPLYGKLVNSILIPGKLPLNFLVNS